MANVYDAIEDFYKNDPDWDLVLPRQEVEGFFRRMAWQGTTDEKMQQQWDYLVMLCIYMENAGLELGDMGEDDFIDLISWCGQNVVDFSITYDSVKAFLETLGQFFVYLKKSGLAESSLPPYLAEQQLLKDDGTLAIIDSEGRYLPGEEEREAQAAPPSEGRVFLNAGESLSGLMEEIHQFYQQPQFNLDFERAMALYGDAMGNLDPSLIGPEADKFWRGFWDYFLFDYHLLLGDETPLKYFRDKGGSQYPLLVNELCQGTLALFTIEEVVDEGRYVCRDFMTREPYFLTFYVDGDGPLEEKIFLGHVFYNRSMGMNYLQNCTLLPLAQKRLWEVLSDCEDWFDVQKPGASWEDFVARHALVCRKVLRLAGKNPALLRFPYDTKQRDYQPPALEEEYTKVDTLIRDIYLGTGRSVYDIRLTRRMWQDLLKAGADKDAYPVTVWAAALARNFVELNEQMQRPFRAHYLLPLGISRDSMEKAYEEVKQRLHLEPGDPRYLDEQGFLRLFGAERRESDK